MLYWVVYERKGENGIPGCRFPKSYKTKEEYRGEELDEGVRFVKGGLTKAEADKLVNEGAPAEREMEHYLENFRMRDGSLEDGGFGRFVEDVGRELGERF